MVISEKDIKSSQEKRIFYDLTAHYECDFENTTPEILANFLFETLTRIMRTVPGVDKSDNSRTAEYQTSQVEYLDPKNGKTTQHALIVHGKKVRYLGKGDIQGVEPLTVVPEMLIITVTQGVNRSRLRFDSNELPNDAFKNLVEWVLADIGKTVTVQIKDDTVGNVSPLKQEQPEIKLPEKQNVSTLEEKSITTKPKVVRSEPKKAKSSRKPNTAIIVAFIVLAGTIVAALLGSPIIEKWFSPAPSATETATVTVTLTSRPATPSKTTEPSQTPTRSFTSTAAPLPTEITDAKGVSMVLVPEGEFLMGSEFYDDTSPPHNVLLEDYYIDVYETTNGLYKDCEDAGVCVPPIQLNSNAHLSYYRNDALSDYPVIFVSWKQAKLYCEEWRNARLPTEAEWEKAARGPDNNFYPWGDEYPNGPLTNFDKKIGDTTKVGAYDVGKSYYGLYDMAGNVWEWVEDWYDAYPGNTTSNSFYGTRYRVLRGGSWADEAVHSDRRKALNPGVGYSTAGFRCAKDAP